MKPSKEAAAKTVGLFGLNRTEDIGQKMLETPSMKEVVIVHEKR